MSDVDSLDAVPKNSKYDRFSSSDNNPMLITDLLTGNTYNISVMGDTEPYTISTAKLHLIKFAQKTLTSINNEHRDDYFLGELGQETRQLLRQSGINNLDELNISINNLEKAPASALFEIVKMLSSLRK